MRLKLTCQTELPLSEGFTEAGEFCSKNGGSFIMLDGWCWSRQKASALPHVTSPRTAGAPS